MIFKLAQNYGLYCIRLLIRKTETSTSGVLVSRINHLRLLWCMRTIYDCWDRRPSGRRETERFHLLKGGWWMVGGPQKDFSSIVYSIIADVSPWCFPHSTQLLPPKSLHCAHSTSHLPPVTLVFLLLLSTFFFSSLPLTLFSLCLYLSLSLVLPPLLGFGSLLLSWFCDRHKHHRMTNPGM